MKRARQFPLGRSVPWFQIAMVVAAATAAALLPGCAAFAAFERAQSTRHDACVQSCERVLGQTSLGYDDGEGHCTCYSPSQGWERTGQVTMARLGLSQAPSTRVARRD